MEVARDAQTFQFHGPVMLHLFDPGSVTASFDPPDSGRDQAKKG